MSIKEWVKTPEVSLRGWDDQSLIVCSLFEITFFFKWKRKEKENMKFPEMDMALWQCFKN